MHVYVNKEKRETESVIQRGDEDMQQGENVWYRAGGYDAAR